VADTRKTSENPRKFMMGSSKQGVNLVDTVIDSFGEGLVTKEVFGVKRTGSEAVDIVVPNNINQTTSPPAKRRRDKGKEVNRANPIPILPAPPIVQDSNPMVIDSAEVTKRKRTKARRLPVKTSRLDVWDKLSKLDSGLSMLDWIAIDKDAARDMNDGLRDLRIQRPKRSKRHLAVIASGAIDDPMLVNAVEHEESYDLMDGDASSYESDQSSDLDSISDYSDDSDLEFSDTESVYRYPYNLNRMKISSPMRGVVEICGKPVVACFDSGASISVLSKKEIS
jgi:hypothetical protein